MRPAATLLVLLLAVAAPAKPAASLSRSDFPPGFLFGAATSAYQIEGAYLEDNRGLSDWDVYTHQSGNIADNSNGDVADDHYHLYKEDIELMQSLGVNAYRFSISWTRILPRGRFGSINPAGIAFYNSIIDHLIQKNIQPFVTLHHLEVPYELEKRYGSWLSPEMRQDFEYYANICFQAFGDRVKHWTTFNEPNLMAKFMYMTGAYPPNRCSAPFGPCRQGNSSVEPYIAVHNIILAHAATVHLYRQNYQEKQRGIIGIVVSLKWYIPLRNTIEDQIASQRALSFNAGWILDPIFFGDYPQEMREMLGSNLPSFTLADKKILRSKLDFIGLNQYSSIYAKDCSSSPCQFTTTSFEWNALVDISGERGGVPIGNPTGLPSCYDTPGGMEEAVLYIQSKYNNTQIIITENGYSQPKDDNPSVGAINDADRINFLTGYLNSLSSAIRKGADVRGYFVWSLLDNFEWSFGYSLRFGLYYVDYMTQQRTSKMSAKWFRAFLKGASMRDEIDMESTSRRVIE